MYKVSFRLHGAPPEIQLRELTALPRLLSWILGDLQLREWGEDRRKGDGKGRREEGGEYKPHP